MPKRRGSGEDAIMTSLLESLRKREHRIRITLRVALWMITIALPITAYFWWQQVTEMLRVLYGA